MQAAGIKIDSSHKRYASSKAKYASSKASFSKIAGRNLAPITIFGYNLKRASFKEKLAIHLKS